MWQDMRQLNQNRIISILFPSCADRGDDLQRPAAKPRRRSYQSDDDFRPSAASALPREASCATAHLAGLPPPVGKRRAFVPRIKQLLWRKAFSLPGLATLAAQSQSRDSFPGFPPHEITCLSPLIRRGGEFNMFVTHLCGFRRRLSGRQEVPGFASLSNRYINPYLRRNRVTPLMIKSKSGNVMFSV